jgi:hypothetical protein
MKRVKQRRLFLGRPKVLVAAFREIEGKVGGRKLPTRKGVPRKVVTRPSAWDTCFQDEMGSTLYDPIRPP